VHSSLAHANGQAQTLKIVETGPTEIRPISTVASTNVKDTQKFGDFGAFKPGA
jgi:hypothetical protein